MAIFGKHNNEREEVVKKNSTETTVIANGANMKGEFAFECRLHVDGYIEGVIDSNNLIVIGKRGHIKGELRAEKLVVSGKFEGSANCSKVEVLTDGMYTGDVLSNELIIESKAKFQGQSKLKNEKKDEAQIPIIEALPNEEEEH